MTCSYPSCAQPIHCRELCGTHYRKARASGQLRKRYKDKQRGPCEIEGCERPRKARDVCASHYNDVRLANAPICSIEGCSVNSLARGWCRSHYSKWKLYGDPTAGRMTWSEIEAQEQEGHKYCRTCNTVKPFEDFHVRITRSGSEVPRSACKQCNRDIWVKNRERSLASKAIANYGISSEVYNELVNGLCQVCGGGNSRAGRRLHIDHCHKTGKVRGALCHRCNTALGLAGDSPERLRDLAAYIERARAS